jgi:hypothetical protein
MLLMSKLFLSCFYATFKQWLQEVKNPYTYFSFIRLITNFYDMYIMYSQLNFYFIFKFLLQSKVQKIKQ